MKRCMKPKDREALIGVAYRVLVQHGPLTSLALAELIGISRRQATDVLRQIYIQDGSEPIDIVPHPEFRGRWMKLWQAKSWQPRQVGRPALLEQRVTITDDDVAWMAGLQRRAAEKAAFRNAAR